MPLVGQEGGKRWRANRGGGEESADRHAHEVRFVGGVGVPEEDLGRSAPEVQAGTGRGCEGDLGPVLWSQRLACGVIVFFDSPLLMTFTCLLLR